MSRLAQNLVDIFLVVANDEDLLRLLYYADDPLNPSKTNVKDLPDFYEIRNKLIIRAPKTNDIEEQKICRLCIYFGNRNNTTSPTQFAFQDVVTDIYTHIDTYEMNDARSLLIADRLNVLLHNQDITGFSKIKSDRMFIIGNPPSGYLGYKYTYEFVSENY